jgi:hypothetical protein
MVIYCSLFETIRITNLVIPEKWEAPWIYKSISGDLPILKKGAKNVWKMVFDHVIWDRCDFGGVCQATGNLDHASDFPLYYEYDPEFNFIDKIIFRTGEREQKNSDLVIN